MRILPFMLAGCVTAMSLFGLQAADVAAHPHMRDESFAEVEDLPVGIIGVDPVAVRNALAAARKANLAAFHTYRTAGSYPHNTYQPGALNVWIDAEGHTCAAATIIKLSGAEDLVTQTARENNFIRLVDVKDGALMDWILTSGLTQAELVTIQVPFMDIPSPAEQRANARAVADAARARKREDAKLAKKYVVIEKMLAAKKQTEQSLEIATVRLMQHPELARDLVERFGNVPQAVAPVAPITPAPSAPDVAPAPRFAQPPSA